MPVNSPGERLTDIILSHRMTKKEFALALGYNPSYITQICLNVKQPSKEFAAKLEKRFGVSSDWILYGDEENHNPASVRAVSLLKQSVIAKIERIESDEELHAVLAYIRCYEEFSKEEFRSANLKSLITLNTKPKLFTIPVKGEVAGGLPITAYEENEETIEAPIFADSALYIKGKSMEPDYPDGSLILIKENAYVINGDVVVALIMKEAEVAEATCKIFRKSRGKITLSPINTDFGEQTYYAKDGNEIKIYGKVIGSVK